MKAEEFRTHLTKDLIPFWNKMKDIEHGGFYGYADSKAVPDRTADKGLILGCRILWFYSSAYLLLKDPELLENAVHAYRFLAAHFFDEQYGGVYWSVTFDGKVSDDTKFTYAQAYAIYALSAFSRTAWAAQSADAKNMELSKKALELALNVYDVIETNCRDARGYFDAYYRDFSPKENDKLSENGVIAERTMNSSLHVLESYTELYKACKEHLSSPLFSAQDNRLSRNPGEASNPAAVTAGLPETVRSADTQLKSMQSLLKEKVSEIAQSLRKVLRLFHDKIYDPEKQICGVFFDGDFNSIIDLDSYGHDIEAAWLIERAAEVLEDQTLQEELLPMINGLSENVLRNGMEKPFRITLPERESFETGTATTSGTNAQNQLLPAEGEARIDDAICAALNNECERGVVDTQKIWWVQAETVIGFYNAYQNQPEKTEFLHQADAVWNYIQNFVIDKKTGEWFESLPADNLPVPDQPLVHAWKCPYHNGRMCMEMIKRLG